MCTRYIRPETGDVECHWQVGAHNPMPRVRDVFSRSAGPFIRAARLSARDERELVIDQWALVPWFAKTPGAWGLAGLWNAWVVKSTGEVVQSPTMLTINADTHPPMKPMHKPDPKLTPEMQDKRSLVPIALEDVDTSLMTLLALLALLGPLALLAQAAQLLRLADVELFAAEPAAA